MLPPDCGWLARQTEDANPRLLVNERSGRAITSGIGKHAAEYAHISGYLGQDFTHY